MNISFSVHYHSKKKKKKKVCVHRGSYHSWTDQILDRFLDLSHVHSSREVEIFVEKVPVPVLFGSPCPRPDSPRCGARTRFISDTIKGVEHCLISRKSFLCDHISNQADKIFIWNLFCSLSEFLNWFQKSLWFRFRQEILRLPTLLNRLQMYQDVLFRPIFQGFEDLYFLRWHWVGDLNMYLPRRTEGLLDIINLPNQRTTKNTQNMFQNQEL